MSGRQAALVAVLGAILAACAAAAGPAPSDPVGVATPHATSSLARVTPEPTTVVATPTPTPEPRATPTPVVVPPKPTGLTFGTETEVIWSGAPGDDDDTGDTTFTVTWVAPRTEGVTMRVYGVTECFGVEGDPGWAERGGPCLVEHTPLPASVRELIAKAPASAGTVSWTCPNEPLDGLVTKGPDCTIYESIVIASYNAAGHSIFAIVEPGHWYEVSDLGAGE
jgi:hypothetical protein